MSMVNRMVCSGRVKCSSLFISVVELCRYSGNYC